jgi:hypothetical protein
VSVLLQRQASTEEVTLEVQVGIDGQGMPSYESPVTIDAHVVRLVEDLRDIQTRSGLATLRSVATIYVDAHQEPVPAIDDRITTEDGLLTGVVIVREEVPSLSRGLDHVVLKIREE